MIAPDASGPRPLTSEMLRTRHGFFTREGGVSSGEYGSLQCGWGAKADPRINVAENRARAARSLGAAPDRLVTLYQVHSARVVTLDRPLEPDEAGEADGLVAKTPGLALGVLAADCAPVLFEDAEAGVIGACHAGWKGALGGVLEATIDAMAALGAARDRIVAVVGPCISQASYEVGPEYVERFLDADPDNARYFAGARDAERAAAGHAQFDLPGYALGRLRGAGVAEAGWLGRCTLADESLFFSHRRGVLAGASDYGRLLSAIILEDRA